MKKQQPHKQSADTTSITLPTKLLKVVTITAIAMAMTREELVIAALAERFGE